MASPAVTSELRAALEWLQWRQRALRGAISSAEEEQIEGDDFTRWQQEMKDIACDAEDLIDEFEYEELRRQIGGRDGPASSLSEEVIMLQKIIDFRQRMEATLRQRMEAMLRQKKGPGFEDPLGGWGDKEVITQGERTQPVPLTKKGEVIGREKEKEEIIEFLVGSDDEVSPTIAITGMGGMGKTTLAQLVYDDSRVEAHFTKKMWVCVTPDADVVEITRAILGSIYRLEYGVGQLCGVENLDVCQRMLVSKLKGQRFLLVMDNLMDSDYRTWQTIYAPLFYGEKGSKVLITTRDEHVARNVLATKTVELRGLHFYDCWRLFKMHAFPYGYCGEHPSLEATGKQIVDKFKGVPLAAVVMGGHLGSRLEEDEWMRILESRDIWEKHYEDGILSVLKLSYDHLPPRLKQCFAYCSLFPKNYKFDRLELVHLWMAQGFVQTKRRKRMEDVGTEYFNDLFQRSFFQSADDGKFAIHDLMHDLAQLVSHCDHSITDINRGLVHQMFLNRDVRHLSLLVNRWQPNQTSDLEALCRYRNLRTLAFNYSRRIKFQIPHDLFLSLNRLRALDLSCGGLETLPDCIGSLIHLRYLDIEKNNFRELPESLCQLYFLQTLKLKDCNFLGELPRGISNLVNLRHLEAEARVLSKVVGFGKLTCLQELEDLPISEEGHGIKIEDLKNMNDLRGKISIQNLSRVRSKDEAVQAMLSRKRYLRKLVMGWGGRSYYLEEGGDHHKEEAEEEIFEALAPPLDLKELSIEYYGGLKFPSWVEQPGFTMLESLCLRGCGNLSSLPQLWRLPFLKRVALLACPQLKNLPPISTSLRELIMIDCIGLEELPELYQPPDHHESFNISATPSLSVLSICHCHALKSLQRGLLRCHLRHLTVLRIRNCRELSEWPEGDEFRDTLLSLQEELCLEGCAKLRSFPAGSTLSASLEKLSIKDCPNVLDGPLFASLQDLPSESIVHASNCYANLQCLFEEALQHIRAIGWLVIDEFCEVADLERGCPLHLACDKERLWSWRCDKWIVAWRVEITTQNKTLLSPARLAVRKCYVSPEDWWGSSSPPRTRGGRRRQHAVRPSPPGRSPNPGATSNLQASVERLRISYCRGTRPLLTEALLTHAANLKELQIFDSPELTLSSLQEVIPSLPSLQRLTIRGCPSLSSSLHLLHHPEQPGLETLFVDDDTLLGDAGLVRGYLRSLRGLHIWDSIRLTSFTAEAEEGLRCLGRSLCHLSFKHCPNLERLPSDLRGLLPSLKALSIGDCPMLRRLPEGGLPACLEILVIHDCCLLEGRCAPPLPPAGEKGQRPQQTDWHKISHVRVIVNQGDLVQGSYREFLELRDKWRDFLEATWTTRTHPLKSSMVMQYGTSSNMCIPITPTLVS